MEDAVTDNWSQAPDTFKSTGFWTLVLTWIAIFPFLSCANSKGIYYLAILAVILTMIFAVASVNGTDHYSPPIRNNALFY